MGLSILCAALNAADSTTPAAPREKRRPAGSLALAMVFCAAFAARFCIHPTSETDAGWHVALGRLMLAGHFPRANVLTWTAPTQPWYPTSWLWDVLSALAARAGDVLGLELMVIAFFLALLAGIAIACERASGAAWTAWLAPASFFTLWRFAVPRPHMGSLAAVAIVFALCVRERSHDSPPIWRRLVALVVVALAGNLHAGAAFAAFPLGLYALEAAWHERRSQRSNWRELAIFFAAPLVLAANPGGLFNLEYLVGNLHAQQIVEVVELTPPTLQSFPVFFALIVPCAAFAVLRFRKTPALCVSVFVFIVLGMRTQRLTQLLLVAAPILLAPELRLLLTRLPQEIPRQRAVVLLMTLLIGLCALCADAGVLLENPLHAAWSEDRVPVRATRFLIEQNIQGRGFNSMADGGYLSYARPGIPTFSDGRLQAFPDNFFPSWTAAEQHNESFRVWLGTFDVEYALTTRLKEKLGGYRALNSPQWALVYWDDLNEVWLRRDVSRFAELIARFEYKAFRPYGSIVGSIAERDRAGLLELDREVARFALSSPGEPFSQVVICGSAIRQEREGAQAFCAQIAESARTQGRPEIAALVAKAVALPPLSKT